MMSFAWLKINRRLILSAVVRFGLAIAFMANLILSGCLADSEETPRAKATATSPYATGMIAQGYVELVGDDLAAPPMPPEPSQADLGAEVYWQICLACHGDWGQGLTDAWREEWEEDSNCWQSRCHAPNHPPQGFQLPKTVPPVLGPESLNRFGTAAELHQNIFNAMPWWNPGSLSDEQSWQLTAYLMRTRGEVGDQVTFDAGNAAVYRLHISNTPAPNPRPGIFLLAFSLAVVALALTRWRRIP